MSYGSRQAILTKGFSLRTALVKCVPQVLAIHLDQGSSSQTMKQLELKWPLTSTYCSDIGHKALYNAS